MVFGWGKRDSGGTIAAVPPADDVILSVRDLDVDYRVARGRVQAVRHVSFDLKRGETLALIGESGSGKSTLALALIRLLVRSASVRSGAVLYQRGSERYDVLRLNGGALRRFRWKECALVFQAAQNALNPVLRVADQFRDTAKAHGLRDDGAIKKRTLELLGLVQLDAERVYRAYPHELSGGMRQRVLLALGLLLDPQLIILDEPTTALDILTQRTIIDLLRRLKTQLGFAMILVSHDLSLAAELADRVATVYAGRIVECGEVRDIFYRPHHPYTVGLLSAVPTITGGFRVLASVRGSPPDLIDLPPGCKFHPRCEFATEECMASEPELVPVAIAGGAGAAPDGSVQVAACFHMETVAARWQQRVAEAMAAAAAGGTMLAPVALEDVEPEAALAASSLGSIGVGVSPGESTTASGVGR
jgi:peptide/nickel transport system ATP-binding protein